MAASLIRVSSSPGEERVALLDEDGRPLDYAVERPDRPEGVGDLFLARVSAVAPAMAGAFVLLPGNVTGFLPESEAGAARQPIGRSVTEGQWLGVRCTRAAQGGKGPRLTARLDAGENALIAVAPTGTPRLVRRGPDVALRFASAHPDLPVETDGAPAAARLRARLGPQRVTLLRQPAFDDALEAELDQLAGAEVSLPGGGRLLVYPTPALTAIDVDAGAAAGSRDGAAHLRLNLAIIPELARQLRLRNLAGAILVDFAGMAVRRRDALIQPLRAALGADPLQPRLLGLTGLGLAEIVRPRRHRPLHEVLGWPVSPFSHGLVALRRAARESAAAPGRQLILRAAPAVVSALHGRPAGLEALRETAGFPLRLVEDFALAPGQESVEVAAR